MAKSPSWIVLADGGVRCERCGKVELMPLPMPVQAFQPWTEYVTALHAGCKDTGRVDEAPTSVSAWLVGHDTGISSKTIYRHMSGLPQDPRWGAGYPLDPSDFGRCYRLLALAPQWRARIGEMAVYGKEWAALAGAWGELSVLYEQELPFGQAPKLYARMRELRHASTGGER